MTLDLNRMAAILRRNEGLRLKPYHCTAGKLTVGYGRNLEDVGITRDEAEAMLANDIRKTAADLDWALPWWRDLSDVRQEALCDMAFNLGLPRLSGFRRMLAALSEGQWADAAAECLNSKYARDVGARAERNAHALEHGEWPQ